MTPNANVSLALVNGRVRTLDPDREHAEAVAVAGRTIAAVGTDDEVRSFCNPRTEVVDLRGATVVPGLIDAHMHPFLGAVMARGVDLLDAHTLDDVLLGLHEESRACSPGEWVLGWGLDYNAVKDSAITSAVIDEVVGGAPAAVMFQDGHTMLASTRALELAGVDGPRTFAEHAEVVCINGRPTGELRENAAMDLVRDVIPVLTAEQKYQLCAEHLRRLAAVGLTGTHMMDGTLEWLELLARLESRGDLVTRILAPFTINPDTPEELWEVYVAAGAARGRRWRAGVAKFFIDGVIDSGTGWLIEPDSQGECREAFWPDVDRYRRAVAFFASHGFQCVTHATGDRGVREALDAYEAAGAPPGARHRIEHVSTLHPSDLPRFASLGVVASMQPEHIKWLSADHTDSWSRRIGPARRHHAFRTRSLLESRAIVAFGSDWPVARFDPRSGMAVARLRRPPGDRDRASYDDQAIDGLQALCGYTVAAALAGGDAGRLGRVKRGFAADLTVLAADPVECEPDELIGVPVLATVVDGDVVFRSSVLS